MNKINKTILTLILFTILVVMPVNGGTVQADATTGNLTAQILRIVDSVGLIIGYTVDGYGCDASYCIYQPWYAPGQIYAKNGSTGAVDYSGTNIGTVANQTYQDGKPKYVSTACGNYTLNEKIIIDDDQSFFASECVNITLASGISLSAAIETKDFASLQFQNKWQAADVPDGFYIGGGFVLNGNKDGGATSNGTNIYGKRYVIDGMVITNFSGTGLYSELGFSGNFINYRELPEAVIDITVRENNGNGIMWRGPHDSIIRKAIISKHRTVGTYGFINQGSAGVYNGAISIDYLHAYGNDVGVQLNYTTEANTIVAESNINYDMEINTALGTFNKIEVYDLNSTGDENGLKLLQNGNFIGMLYAHNYGNTKTAVNVTGSFNTLGVHIKNNTGTGLYLYNGDDNNIRGRVYVTGTGLMLENSIRNNIDLNMQGASGTYVGTLINITQGTNNQNSWNINGNTGTVDYGFNGTPSATDGGRIDISGSGNNLLDVHLISGVADFGAVAATSNATRPSAFRKGDKYSNSTKYWADECVAIAAGQDSWYYDGNHSGGC